MNESRRELILDILAAMKRSWGDRWWAQARQFMMDRDTVREQWMSEHNHDPRTATPREIADSLVALGWTADRFSRSLW